MQQIESGGRFIAEFEKTKSFSVSAAFWLKAREEDQWYLYISSDQIDDTNFDLAYKEVLRLTSRMSDPWLDPFEVKVVSSKNAFANDVIELQQRFPASLPTRLRGRPLGGVLIDEAYIYPLPCPVSN